MDTLKIWLLEAAVEGEVPLRYLSGSAGLLSHAAHGADQRQLASTLTAMHAAGEIEWLSTGSGGPGAPVRPVEAGEGLRAMAAAGLAYALTPEGGAAWEAIARPDWSRFVSHAWQKPQGDERNAWVEGGNRQWVTSMVEWLAEDGWEVRDEEWQDRVPYRALYWKVLPRGFRVAYRSPSRRAPEHAQSLEARLKRHDKFAELKAWYTPAAEGGPLEVRPG